MPKKKRKSAKLDEAKKTRTTSTKASTSEEESGDENPLNFGGLPDRNLKKNLGCS